jgi:hypothetical protein
MPASELHADRPISGRREDLLERGALVSQLAGWVANAPMDGGFVVGLTGPWGSGKTSVLGLVAEHLEGEDVTVVWFEPWLFSDADQLVTRFFDEVADQLKGARGPRLARIAGRMAEYGAALSPGASALLGPVGQLLGLARELKPLLEKSTHQRRLELQRALRTARRRIVVLIDDIDRLDAREVREILRLVKLVADLPGVVHVLSYDRARVAQALRTSGIEDGQAFMEKIVQATMAVPPISKDRLNRMSLGWLDDSIGDRRLESWDTRAWGGLWDRGIVEYLRTLRDGRRLANIAPAALDLCEDEVASMDVLALEALRIFDPAIHEALPRATHILTGVSRIPYDLRPRAKVNAEHREELASLFEQSEHPQATSALLSELFPAAAQALAGYPAAGYIHEPLKAKRVAAPAVLTRYLHLTLEASQAPSTAVDRAVRALSDADAFRACLDDVEDSTLGDLLARAQSRVDEVARPDVVECSRVLLDLIPRIPPWGLLDVSPQRQAMWFIEALVAQLPSVSARASAAGTLIEQAPTLSLRFELLYRFRVPPDGPSKAPELDLLRGKEFAQLERGLAEATLQVDDEQLAAERNVYFLLDVVRDVAGPRRVLERLRAEPVLRAVLETPGTRVRPVTDGGPTIDIEALVRLAGKPVLTLLREIARPPSPLTEEVRIVVLAALAAFRAKPRRPRHTR